MLLFEDVTLRTGDGQALEGVDLVVRRGACHALLTTDPGVTAAVVGLLLGEQQPAAGRVRVDGLDPVVDAELLTGRVRVAGAGPHGPVPPTAADVVIVTATARPGAQLDGLLPRAADADHRTPMTVLLVTDDPVLAERHCHRVDHLPRVPTPRPSTPRSTTHPPTDHPRSSS